MKRFLFSGIFVVLTTLLVSTQLVKAQQPSLTITAINNLPDTIYEGQPYTFNVFVQNNSNNLFSGTIYVLMAQDSGSTGIDTLTIDTGQTIGGGFFVTIQIDSHYFSPNLYKTGGNTVVVWPLANNTNTIDSLNTGFYYVKFSGMDNGNLKQNNIDIIPNPARDFFTLNGNNLPGYVRIYSSDGRLVYDKPFSGRKINTDTLKPGIYLIEFRYKNQKNIFKKLLKL